MSTLPFTLLTGYLGSGKTTLLNRLLGDARFRNSLVIINELADLALDGTRLTDVDMEYVVLNSGCVCCTTNADLTNTVAKALFRREHNLLPKFDRFVLETTGAADPYPLIASFGSRGNLAHLCHIEAVIATVDGLIGETQLDEHAEVAAHVGAADHVVLTKSDLRTTPIAPLRDRITALNPLATLSVSPTALDVGELLSSGLRDADTGEANWQRWLRHHPSAHRHDTEAHAHHHHHSSHHHDAAAPPSHLTPLSVLNVTLDSPVHFRRWCHWVAQYIQRYGQRVLRLKAVLVTDTFDSPIAFDAVRDIVHAPVELGANAVPDRRSRVVLLCRDVPELELRLLEAAIRETQSP
jgi:G3E family GTPase